MTSSVTLEHSTNSLICNSLKEKFPEFKAPSIIYICNLKYVCRFFAYNKITFHRRKLKFLETNCGNRTPAYRSRSVNRSYFSTCKVLLVQNHFIITWMLDTTARKPSFTVNFAKWWIPGKSCINRPFSDIGKRSVNSTFSLCERQENMRLIQCFHGLDKRRLTPCFPLRFLSFSRAD